MADLDDSSLDDDAAASASAAPGVPSPATPQLQRTTTNRATFTPAVPATPAAAASDSDDDDDSSSHHRGLLLTPLSALHQQQHHGNTNDAPFPAAVATDNEQQHIRGTNINVQTAAAAFQDFLRAFVSLEHAQKQHRGDDDDDSMSDTSNDEVETSAAPPPLYQTKLRAILEQFYAGTNINNNSRTLPRHLDVDTMHLFYHSEACQRFYHQLVAFPLEMIPLMDLVLQREVETMLNAHQAPLVTTVPPRLQVRPYNLQVVSQLRALDPAHLDALLAISGMVTRVSSLIPDLKVAHFACAVCGHVETIMLDRGRIAEPPQCVSCQTRASLTLCHNRCVYANKQIVRLQETPDQVPAGQTPAAVLLFLFDEMCDTVTPGDKLEVTGVLRAQPVRVHPKMSKCKALYKTYVDVVHVAKTTGMTRQQQQQDSSWSAAQVAEFKALSRDPDIYDKLVLSLAPSIYELDNVKRGILCMLFGGSQQRRVTMRNDDDDGDTDENDTSNDSATRQITKRGDINILLCGDPGTSKSQLLSYVNKISTRGVYTSGKGSSAVGLTASVVRDPETRDVVLESGALVLSDLGICCIDEFDKMSQMTRSVLHEAMEQQTVSIAKAGIIATLHARTSVLASANPSESRYNPNMSVVDNIQLPPTLLSRFDLIYLVLDSPNVDHDRRLAQHLVGLYYETPNVVEPPISQALLRDYIAYAREHIHPELSDTASEQLVTSYLEMRNPGGGVAVGMNSNRTITATPRQLESLIRISEALAKMRYSETVTRADVYEAVRLMKVATQAAATDPRTGRIDMDMITTGRSAADRELQEHVKTALTELLAARRGSRLAVRDVSRQLAEIANTTLSHDDVVRELHALEADGMIQYNERGQTIFVRAGV